MLALSSQQLRRQAQVGARAALAVGEHPATAPLITMGAMVGTLQILPKFQTPRRVAIALVGVGGAVAFWGAQKNRVTPALGIGVMTGALLSLIAPPKPLPETVRRHHG